MLSSSDIQQLQHVLTTLDAVERSYVRFAYVSEQVDFLGHRVPVKQFLILSEAPSTFPEGYIPHQAYTTFQVLNANACNLQYEPLLDRVSPIPDSSCDAS
jgi:hypothetical protein